MSSHLRRLGCLSFLLLSFIPTNKHLRVKRLLIWEKFAWIPHQAPQEEEQRRRKSKRRWNRRRKTAGGLASVVSPPIKYVCLCVWIPDIYSIYLNIPCYGLINKERRLTWDQLSSLQIESLINKSNIRTWNSNQWNRRRWRPQPKGKKMGKTRRTLRSPQQKKNNLTLNKQKQR